MLYNNKTVNYIVGQYFKFLIWLVTLLIFVVLIYVFAGAFDFGIQVLLNVVLSHLAWVLGIPEVFNLLWFDHVKGVFFLSLNSFFFFRRNRHRGVVKDFVCHLKI